MAEHGFEENLSPPPYSIVNIIQKAGKNTSRRIYCDWTDMVWSPCWVPVSVHAYGQGQVQLGRHESLHAARTVRTGATRWRVGALWAPIAMKILINQLLKNGRKRGNLEAKVFVALGIARFTVNNVGERNAEFVLEFLRRNILPW